jgi:hypothetical protein
MITFLVQTNDTDVRRAQASWLKQPLRRWLWRIPQRAFRTPLPSVWELVPLQRLAASLEIRGSLCEAVPPSTFVRYVTGDWYREWRELALIVQNRAAAGDLKEFSQLLGTYSPAIVIGRDHESIRTSGDAMTSMRSIRTLVAEVESLVKAIDRHERRSTYSVEWATSQVVIASCNRAIRDRENLLMIPQPASASYNDVIELTTIPIRGMHCIRRVAVLDEGRMIEVTFASGDSYRVAETQVRSDAHAANLRFGRIAKVRIRRSSVMVISDESGNSIEYSPHRILHVSEARFRD